MGSKVRMIGVAGAGSALGVMALLIAFTGPWEGLKLRAYQDVVGVWTICRGETLNVAPGDVATEAECDEMFARRLAEFRDGVDACLVPSVPAEVEVAFVDLAYNVGVGLVCRSTLMRKANAGDLRGACLELSNWVRAGGRVIKGLVNRRAAAQRLCLAGLR